MQTSIRALALIFATASTLATAGGTPPTAITKGSNYQTKAYAGLKWTLGGSTTPALVLGVANAKTKSNGQSTGSDLAVSFALPGGLMPQSVKLSYLNGTHNTQGEIGAGYNFATAKPFTGVGIRAPFVTIGADFDYQGMKLMPNLTVHTLDSFDKPDTVTVLQPT